MSEGGARKGLPKSFLNRFLQVTKNYLITIINKIK